MNTCAIAPPRTAHTRAALDYLARGWWPVPVVPAKIGDAKSGKAPLVAGWPNLRMTADEIERTWNVPTPPNVGILTGEPSRLVVLDFDDPQEFRRWREARPDAARTRTVARPNAFGRCHLYFAVPEGQAVPASTKGAGWDFLSTGRQVVAPPSLHYSGEPYELTNPAPPLPWQDEYLPGALAWNDTIGPRPGAYAQAALAGEAAAVAATPEGARNTRLNVAAVKIGHLVAGGELPAAEAEAALLDAAAVVGLPAREARKTVESGLRAGAREPKHVPPAGATPFVLRTPQAPATPPDPWGEPVPFGPGAVPPPPWPWETLPAVLGDMGQAVAAALNAPECMAGAAVLGCASIAAGNRVAVTIKPGHVVTPNLYWLVAAPVGTGKTPTLKPLQAPLLDWEAEQVGAYLRAVAEWRAGDMVRDGRRAALKREAARKGADLAMVEAELADLEETAPPEPPEPRLFVADATSEALGRRLAENGERMGVMSSEARKILAIARGRYTDGRGDLDLWLAGHAGDPHRVDRQGRAPYVLRRPCLSALLLTQPDALASIGEDPEARASGFLARFLYVCPEEAGARPYPRGSVPEPIDRAYRAAIRRVLDMETDTDPDGKPRPQNVPLEPAALELFCELYAGWGQELNAAAAAGGLFFAEWLGKCRETAARLALLFAVIEARPVVTLDAMADAGRLCEHLKVHAQRAAAVIGETREAADARHVWNWCASRRQALADTRAAEGCGAVPAVKARDLVRAGLAGCENTEAASRALRVLEERGYVQGILWQRPDGRAKPHELWYLHPKGEL